MGCPGLTPEQLVCLNVRNLNKRAYCNSGLCECEEGVGF